MLKVFFILFPGLFLFNACEKEDERMEEEMVKLQEFLEEKGYTSVEPTSSGLYHVVLTEGNGENPVRSDFVNISFIASLVDGTVFETSDRNIAMNHDIVRDDKLYGPAKFQIQSLGITGLIEGLMLMKEGGISRIIIPSGLAFGSIDYGIIPPYSTLIYDVELHDVISDPVEHEKNLLDDYIEENDITVTPTESGLYYIEKEEGEGDLPGENASVTLHYTGALLDGRVFDETESDNPMVMSTGATNIIPGFIEGIKKMKKNGKARLIIPWSIGYGAEGSSEGIIPPYSTLVFDIEVIDIE
ncbi:MAG: FKBP-type peptidyl-prolyl cis-trans isomerase [Bacteroidales bacterium]